MVKKTLVLSTQFFSVFIFAIVAIVAMAIAKHKKFFSQRQIEKKINVDLKIVLSIFFIYIVINCLISPFFLVILKKLFIQADPLNKINYISTISLINLFNYFLIFLTFWIIFAFMAKGLFKSIWKESSSSYFDDIKIGFLTWFLAFPTVLFISNALEMILSNVFKIQNIPNQIAIEYVKLAYKYPLHFSIAIFSIVICAPLIEEVLFRGILQNHLKKYFNVKNAIIITSIIFALFHISSSQKFSNIIIFVSLFVLSLFLGFVYEKQRSLISPITLHATFNAISIINLLIAKNLP